MTPIWIDLDNAPHVHLFAPIADELRERGFQTLITVRSHGQTEGLAEHYGMKFTTVGAYSAHTTFAGRACETLLRAAQLVEFGAAHRPALAVSHGSRALTLAAAFLGLPSIVLYDYEHIASGLFHRFATKVLVPEAVVRDGASDGREAYPGFKEDVYVHDFEPDDAILRQLHLDRGRLIITVRPPATWAHYHHDDSTTLFRVLLEHLRNWADAQVVVLARTQAQATEIRREFLLDRSRFLVTAEAVDGLSLLYYSDAAFSGGGTMVREAAGLGVPAYSTFAGRSGAVDRELQRQGKLKVLTSSSEIAQLRFLKRRLPTYRRVPSSTRTFIVDRIVELANER
jgi:predicted glycosyltransferase